MTAQELYEKVKDLPKEAWPDDLEYHYTTVSGGLEQWWAHHNKTSVIIAIAAFEKSLREWIIRQGYELSVHYVNLTMVLSKDGNRVLRKDHNNWDSWLDFLIESVKYIESHKKPTLEEKLKKLFPGQELKSLISTNQYQICGLTFTLNQDGSINSVISDGNMITDLWKPIIEGMK